MAESHTHGFSSLLLYTVCHCIVEFWQLSYYYYYNSHLEAWNQMFIAPPKTNYVLLILSTEYRCVQYTYTLQFITYFGNLTIHPNFHTENKKKIERKCLGSGYYLLFLRHYHFSFHIEPSSHRTTQLSFVIAKSSLNY